MDERRIREIYAATIGFSAHSDDVSFGMAVALETLTAAAAICEKRAENASDDEAYSLGMACAGDIKELGRDGG